MIAAPAWAEELSGATNDQLSSYGALLKLDEETSAGSGQDVLNSLADVELDQSGQDFVADTTHGSEVSVPLDPSESLSITTDGTELLVELPGSATSNEATIADGNAIEYVNTEGFSVFPLVKDDASVQIATVIEGPDSPEAYDFVIGTDDLSVEITDDGFAIFTDSIGSFVGASPPAWAIDANGISVPTHFEADGNVLRQVVDHSASDVAYPVVADPYLGKSLISSVTKTTEKGKPRYAVKKTTWGNSVALGYGIARDEQPLLGASIMRDQGWTEARKKGAGAQTTIKQQYDCHTVYAAAKNPWNLEAHRSTRSNWLISPKLCNW